MERFACRALVRVMRPKTMVLTVGRRGPVVRWTETVGIFDVFEGWERMGPEMLECKVES